MLVVGTHHRKLKPSDVLISVDGKLITRFLELEEILDDKVGEQVRIVFSFNGKR